MTALLAKRNFAINAYTFIIKQYSILQILVFDIYMSDDTD